VRGQLTIGCSDTVSSYLLPPILSDFIEKYPNIEITVQNRPSPHIIHMVLDRTADVGLVTMPVTDDDLKVRQLFSYRNVAICSPEHSFAKHSSTHLSSLARHRLLLLEPGTKNRMLLDEAFARVNVSPGSLMEFGSVEVQKSFAETGIGIAIVPDFAVRKKRDRNLLKIIRIRRIPRCETGVIVRKNRKLSPAVQEFISLLYAHKKLSAIQ
jgi:DNA-binding transcriptional LysR family regulator